MLVVDPRTDHPLTPHLLVVATERERGELADELRAAVPGSDITIATSPSDGQRLLAANTYDAVVVQLDDDRVFETNGASIPVLHCVTPKTPGAPRPCVERNGDAGTNSRLLAAALRPLLPRHGGDPTEGRLAERAAMSRALREALNGRGGTLLVTGDEGMGKTRHVRELADEAIQHGARAVFGRCRDTGWAEPLGAWSSALDELLSGNPSLCDTASELARQVPELTAMLVRPEPHAPPSTSLDGRHGRLVSVLVRLLRVACEDRPLVLVLEDVHEADAPTLRLLESISAEVSSMHLLLVATCRTGGGRNLASLERRFAHRIVRLSGLTAPEAQAYLEHRTAVVPDVVSLVFEVTGGNPLFLELTVEFLRAHELGDRPPMRGACFPMNSPRAERAAERERAGSGGPRRALPDGGEGRSPSLSSIAIGQSLRGIIARRFENLASFCQGALEVCAVIGEEFEIVMVERIGRFDADTLASLLHEAEAAGFVARVDRATDTFRFRHGSFREVIYGRLLPSTRSRLHLEVAQALAARWEAGLAPSLTEVVEHHLRADGPVSAIVHWAKLGAELATSRMAHDEAAHLLRRALEASRRGAEPEVVCDLQSRLASALWRVGKFDEATRGALEAVGLARRLRRTDLLAEAALALAGPAVGFGAVPYEERVVAALRDALAALPPHDDPLRARVMARFAGELVFLSAGGASWPLAHDAVAMARRLGDPAVLAYVLRATEWARWEPLALEGREALAAELLALGRETNDAAMRLEGHMLRMWVLLERGDLAAAEVQLLRCIPLAEELRQPYYDWLVKTARVCLLTARGRFREAAVVMQEALAVGQQSENANATLFFAAQQGVIWFLTGDFSHLRRAMRGIGESFPALMPIVRGTQANNYADEGRVDEARHLLEAVMANDLQHLARTVTWLPAVAFLADTCAAIGDAERARELYEMLLPFRGRYVILPPVTVHGPVDLYLGRLAATLGRPDDAVAHCETALAIEDRVEKSPWRARVQIALAEILLARRKAGDAERAGDLLRAARSVADQLDLPAIRSRIDAAARQLILAVPPPHPAAARDAVFQLEGRIRRIIYGGTTFSLPESVGLFYVAILLECPGRVISALDLVAARQGAVVRERIVRDPPVVQRLRDVSEALEEAIRHNDEGRIEPLTRQRELLLEEMRVARGGENQAAVRARSSVRHALTDAYRKIARHCPLLAAHLRTHIEAGYSCTYVPDLEHPIRWTVIWSR